MPSASSCSESDIDLLTGLLSWWELTDNVSAIDGADQGVSNLDMLDNSSGLPAAYVHDTTRGDPPGAAVFVPAEGTGFKAVDSAGIYINTYDPVLEVPGEPFTIGLWVRLDAKTLNGTILSYTNGSTTLRYHLRHIVSTDRFVWTVIGASGTATVVADTLGSPTLGTWYWIELTYDPATLLAGIRVAPARTTDLESLDIEADTATVPGGLSENAGALCLGYYGSGVNFSFDGRLAAVGFWARALNSCERGRLNMPTDYPFTAAVAAGFESEGGESSFTAEDGSTTFDPE